MIEPSIIPFEPYHQVLLHSIFPSYAAEIVSAFTSRRFDGLIDHLHYLHIHYAIKPLSQSRSSSSRLLAHQSTSHSLK